VLAGCGVADTYTAEQSVKEQLKDPSSAQFRNVFVSKDGDYVCGEVNAKNGFGAYGGFEKFVVSVSSQSVYMRGLLWSSCER
jgi:hypothetical protein